MADGCDKHKIAPTVWKTITPHAVESRSLLVERLRHRFWTATSLPQDDTHATVRDLLTSRTHAEFLEEFRFDSVTDEHDVGGLTPRLMLCAISGNAPVAVEIVRQNVDVDARTKVDFPQFGIICPARRWKLTLSFCRTSVHEVVVALLEAGAAPTAIAESGATALMAGAGFKNAHAIESLISAPRS